MPQQIRADFKMKVRDALVLFHEKPPDFQGPFPVAVERPVYELHLGDFPVDKKLQLFFTSGRFLNRSFRSSEDRQ